MSDYPEIAARFAGHTVTVLHEDGLYRHLRFEGSAESSLGIYPSYPFELITWPYNLVVKAGWTFHFDIDATPDMFNLFRKTAFSGEINPGYWAEKVRAGRDEVEGFEPHLLKWEIATTIAQWMRDDLDIRIDKRAKELGFTPRELSTQPGVRKELARQVRGEWRNANRQLREAVQDHFFSEFADYNIEYEEEAHRALHDFSFRAEGDDSLYPQCFADWHEWRLKDFTPGFLHCCHAIRCGIDVYDAARKQVAA